MITYYLKIAWRNFKSSKLFSLLNLLGLSVAIAVCIPLFLFIGKERSFDSGYANKDHIYRVNLIPHQKSDETWGSVPNAVAPAMMQDIPEISYAARMLKNGFGTPASLRVGQENFKEDLLYWSDPELFKIFDFQFTAGEGKNPLQEDNAAVINESESRRLFGEASPLGKTIIVDNGPTLVVRGVYKDLPDNSSIDPAMIANFKSSRMSRSIYWSNASYETFCLLKPGSDIKIVNQKVQALTAKYIKDPSDRWFSLSLQPLSEIHLHSAQVMDTYISRIGDIKTVRQIGLLGLLIILIACINYMNLATAKSEKRAREVGINKTLGATRKQMVLRFYADTALLAFLSVVTGFLLSFGSLFLFNSISGSHLAMTDLFGLPTLLFLMVIWVLVTLLAGSYPALLLSGSSALQLMQKRFHAGGLDRVLRKALVVVQFSCSIVLIIAIVIIYQQMRFVGNKNLGFKPDGVLMINISGVAKAQNLVGFTNEISQMPNVRNVAFLQSPPGFGASQRALHKADAKSDLTLYTCHADAEVVPALGLHLLAGQSLPKQLAKTDSAVYVLANKKVVDFMGWTPEQAIGRKVDVDLGENAYIVGVVDNFNYLSLKSPIEPYIYYAANDAPESFNALMVKINTDQLAGTMDKIQSAFGKDVPSVAFDYSFLDSHLATLYNADRVMQRTVLLFSCLAIFVSCLGLFGLSAFMAEQKTKEIGIRKVLGASNFSISRMLSLHFLRLVVLSIIIGIPIAVYLMREWLSNFEYRIHISWLVVALAALSGLLIALITVSYQSVKASRANPVNSIKTE